MFFKNKDKKEVKQRGPPPTIEVKDTDEYFPSQSSGTGKTGNSLVKDNSTSKTNIQKSYQSTSTITPSSVNPTTIAMEFRKLNAKMDSVINWIRQFYSRFSGSLESVNELKAKISTIEVNNSKIEAISSKVDSAEKEVYSMKQDVEDLKKRADVFIGTEELLKLNDKINDNLQELKVMDSEVREGVEKIKNVDFDSISKLGRTPDKITTDLLEKTAILAKQNKEAIGTFSFDDYNEKTDSFLKVIENLADQISDIKKKLESYNQLFSFNKSTKPNGKKIKSDKALLEKSDMDFLEDIGEIPELPELPPSPKSGSVKNKKKNEK